MCDLWKNTLDGDVPPGAITRQIRSALSTLKPAKQIKLYNAGSFFDPRQIPVGDDDDIAGALSGFDRVIVESHPAFLAGAHGKRCERFQTLIAGQLEVAIGLETADPYVLERLNKRMTIDGFRRAAEFLQRRDIALRVFILLNPPYARDESAVEWACRSIDLAAACGASVCSIIPTRGGNGAMEALGSEFTPPRLSALEAVIEYGLTANGAGGAGRASGAGEMRRAGPFGPAGAADEMRRAGPFGPAGLRVFADLWDIERFFSCTCAPERAARLAAMNREQRVLPRVVCECDAP
jgi:radical SAM enzyme (TIGR01210 family)